MASNLANKFEVPATSLVPEGWEIVHRYAIVRLGPGFNQDNLHTAGNHASLGITGLSIDGLYLMVHSDFDNNRELCMDATAHVDLQLAKKGVKAGCSGGAYNTRIGIWSDRTLDFGNGTTRPPYFQLSPASGVFNPDADNLWITMTSMRWIGEGPIPGR